MLLNSNGRSSGNQVLNQISVGIDQGNQLWVMTAIDRDNGKMSRFSFKGKTKEVECYRKVSELVNTGKEVSVCYEAGRSGFTPVRIFENLGCKNNRILPCNKIEIINTGKRPKTDNIDSQFLAELDSTDKRIPSVWVPSIAQECHREIPREEQRIKRDISRNNNRIISILQRWSIPNINVHHTAERWRKEFSLWKKNKAIPKLLPVSEFKRIELMVIELDLLEKHLESWQHYMLEQEEKQRDKCNENNEPFLIDVLREYRGIGDVIARTFCWEIGSFKRFKNGKHFSSYLGLTPTHFASGKMFREQGISKQGNPELRRLAIQLAWLWKHWQPDSAISKKWEDQLKKKGRQRKTAIVAMARQLMVALYRRIEHNEEIEAAVKNKPVKNLIEGENPGRTLLKTRRL